ncbi:MAG: toprim domain-containing protein, partial [Sediminibacterium sp.]|nr:toprim domain-containing protein [Sediminibacterium sp.]
HSLQKGGNLVDFGILFHRCSISELLQKLGQQTPLSFQNPKPLDHPASLPSAGEKGKIIVIDTRQNIKLSVLKEYLEYRRVPLDIANRFCKEVDFLLYDRKYTVIGFQNIAGGFELRSAHFKGSSSPKDVTELGQDLSKKIIVFEGFMDFLSYQAIHLAKFIMRLEQQSNFLILNSIGFLEKMKPKLEQYPSIHLYMDRDKKGKEVTKDALVLSDKYRDESLTYENYKDLNAYLMKEQLETKQSQSRGRKLFR